METLHEVVARASYVNVQRTVYVAATEEKPGIRIGLAVIGCNLPVMSQLRSSPRSMSAS
jgi:hypothetical protein